MNRKPFSQILYEVPINIPKEYQRLIQLFCKENNHIYSHGRISLYDICALNFTNIPFRGTCISLSDFEATHDIRFNTNGIPAVNGIDPLLYLVRFCEFSYNLAVYSQEACSLFPQTERAIPSGNEMSQYIQQVLSVIDKIGYMPNYGKKVTDFVPKDQAAISVTEIVDPELSYRVIEYNHHSMKGDLDIKRSTIIALADKLEPQRKTLGQINSSLESDLFFLLNNINLRHNNSDPAGGKKYHQFVAEMGKDELENWYDETYQMCLLAFLELDNADRKEKVNLLKQNIQM